MKRAPKSVHDDTELSAGTIRYWRLLSINPEFIKIVEYLDSKKGEYSEHKPPSLHQHIQQERNGGMKAWIRLSMLLLNPPQAEEKSVTENTRSFTRHTDI